MAKALATPMSVNAGSKKYGISLGYWVITSISQDVNSGNIYVTVSGWTDQASHDAGNIPIDQKIETVADSGQLALTQASINSMSPYNGT